MNSSNKRDVYLPEGKWIDFFNGKFYEGAIWLKDYMSPLDEMPLWIRYGAKIPFYPEHVNCTDEIDPKEVVQIDFDESFKGIRNTIIGEMTGLAEIGDKDEE
ncbi:hypothetical protein ES705_39998 [subsurface metagenome]